MDSANGVITRTYDDFDQLLSETTPQGTVTYSYDVAGRRTSMTVAGQQPVYYTYDDANRLTQLLQGTDTVILSYDAAGRRTGLTLPNGVTATYSYDAANQLVGISYAKGQTSLGNLAYGYDAAGRRVTVGGTLAQVALPTAVANASYDANNRLTDWAGTALSHDANGNLTHDGANTLSWNERNQLVGISGATLSDFQYDALGRRQTKTVESVATSYLYDGVNLVQELNGLVPVANYLTGLGIDETFQRTDTNGAKAFLTDALGSTIALTDPSGAVATEYTYEPYGKVAVTDGADANPLQYTGRENDGSGYYYYRARYYSPTLQRFIAEDPIGISGGINTYAYVSNNPLRYIDPLGLTQYDIDVARRIAAETQADLRFPESYKVLDLGKTEDGGEILGLTLPGVGTQLDDRYLKPLTNSQAADLLDTIIHEAVHFTWPADDLAHQEDRTRSGFPYDEAKRRTTKELINRFNKERKLPGCKN